MAYGTINENIKNFRTFRGITQSDLAQRIGKSKNVISNWERGDNSPDVDSVEKICRELAVTPNQLFGWDVCPEFKSNARIYAVCKKFATDLQQRHVKKPRLGEP